MSLTIIKVVKIQRFFSKKSVVSANLLFKATDGRIFKKKVV